MCVKALILLLNLLLLYQVKCSPLAVSDNKNGDIGPRDLLEEAIVLVQLVRTTVQTSIDDGTAQIVRYQEEIKNNSKGVLTIGESEIELARDDLIVKLDAIQDQADQAGVDVSECLSGIEDEVVDLADTITNELITCVTNTVKESEQTGNNTIIGIHGTLDVVELLETELSWCTAINIYCITVVMSEASYELVELPRSINNDVMTATQKLEVNKEDLQQCLLTAESGIDGDGNKIVSDAEECAKNIIGQ